MAATNAFESLARENVERVDVRLRVEDVELMDVRALTSFCLPSFTSNVVNIFQMRALHGEILCNHMLCVQNVELMDLNVVSSFQSCPRDVEMHTLMKKLCLSNSSFP